MKVSATIKAELKKLWPNTKFSVRTSGSAVYVDWTNGPSQKKVDEIISKYEYGTFDGMTDCYNYDNVRKDIPQTKYVFTNREISEDILNEKFNYYKNYYSNWKDLKGLDEWGIPMKGNTPRGFIRFELFDICL